jgi:tetratricopeptide (TPR) repeat protein
MEEYGKALAMNPDSTFAQAGLGMCAAGMGNRAGALKAVESLKAMGTRTYVSPGYVALVYHALGDRDAEYAWYEKGFDDQAEWLLWLPVDPIYDNQRSDPRFQALMKKVGVAQ